MNNNYLPRSLESSNKKNVCFIIPGHWSKIMGGSQYQAKIIIEELKKADRYNIFYLARDFDPGYEPAGYKLIRYSYPGSLKHGTHRHLIEMALLPRILNGIRPDIIYQRVGCAQTGIAARYALRNHCRMVYHIASENDLLPNRLSFSRLFVERMMDKYLLNYGIHNAGHIIAQTDDQNRLLENNFNGRTATVVRNLHPFPAEDIRKIDPIKIVWVSNLKSLKQPKIFIRLANELSNLPNTRFIMVGALQGAKRTVSEYRTMIAETGNLEYLGPKSQEEVNSILAESHIFINTSLWEGFPNTFIQAWMRQVPVISLTVDPDRLIRENGLGFVSGSYDRLKHDVAHLVKNPSLRIKIGMDAQKFSMKHFSTRNAEKIIEIFDQ